MQPRLSQMYSSTATAKWYRGSCHCLKPRQACWTPRCAGRWFRRSFSCATVTRHAARHAVSISPRCSHAIGACVVVAWRTCAVRVLCLCTCHVSLNSSMLPHAVTHCQPLCCALQLDAALLLPLLFKLFAVRDKALRQLLFRHIVAGAAHATGCWSWVTAAAAASTSAAAAAAAAVET